EDASSVTQEVFTRGRQRESSSCLLNQRLPGLIFQLAELCADRTLGTTQALGRARETAKLEARYKSSQHVHVEIGAGHNCSIFLKYIFRIMRFSEAFSHHSFIQSSPHPSNNEAHQARC